MNKAFVAMQAERINFHFLKQCILRRTDVTCYDVRN